MKIAILAPLWKRVPPIKYGGTEVVVSLLTEELVKRGHEVTLFACGTSKTKAKLFSIIDKSLYEMLGKFDWNYFYMDLINGGKCYEMANQFDVIHNHVGFTMLPFARLVKTPTLTTLHSSKRELEKLAETYSKENFVSISDAQRNLWPELNYLDTVYHGIDLSKFEFSENSGEYLFFVGTISPEKGADKAIEVAKKTGEKLLIAGDRRPEFENFYKEKIEPFIDDDQIKFLGEITPQMRNKIMKKAKAFIFPISWNEAFGLVLIEAMACGTPVITFNKGAIPEIVENGKTGFIVNDITEMEKSVKMIDKIRRSDCRKIVQEKFTVEKMADNYLKIYEQLVSKK
ncbi:MAG: glycosyltransferase family 4 protein [Patescibacteria group bacterium]|jgi:glycosyltransferase involved in cell wall biosynthesis